MLRLLDDESPVVRRAVRAELQQRPGESVAWLRQTAQSADRRLAENARRWLVELGADDPVKAFRDFIHSFSYELETGCLLLERTVHEETDAGAVCHFLDGLAMRCQEFIREKSSVYEKCKQLNLVIFHEYGFAGNTADYNDPDNNFLQVLTRRRKGLPISLSILYLLVAQRCGFTVEPIGLPGRFLLASFEEPEVFFIDPFDRGRFRSEEEIRQILIGRNLHDAAEYLVPSPVGEILCRICRNLAHQYSTRGDLGRARLFAGFIGDFEAAYERESS